MKIEKHPEIKTIKKLSEITKSEENLKELVGGLFLFSGRCHVMTGFAECVAVKDGKSYVMIKMIANDSVLAYPLYYPNLGTALEDLRDYLDVVIKPTPGESFFIEVDVL